LISCKEKNYGGRKMKNRGIERIRKRLGTSVVVAMMLLLSISMMAMGANQLHWGFGDGEDLPTGQDRGVSYFVDGVGGNDGNSGSTWALAKRTIQAAVNVATTGNGDYIYVKGTEFYEDVTVNKWNLHIIGEGQYQVGVRSFNVLVASVEITGFYIHGSTGTTSIASSNEYLYLHGNTIEIPDSGIGLSITNHNAKVFSNDFRSYGAIAGTGIEISSSATEAHIYDNEFVGFTIGIRLNTAGRKNFIYNNRFYGTSTVFPATGIYGIQISSGNYNTISQNWIGYCTFPISDAGTANAWLDNHWDGWVGSFTLNRGHDTNPQTVISGADIPSEGKVTVRFTFDPGDQDIPGAAKIKAKMVHPTYTTVLLSPVGQWDNALTDQVFPTVEATLDGGNNQMTVTIETDTKLLNAVDSQLEMIYEILDA
jgi:hypothetical protein